MKKKKIIICCVGAAALILAGTVFGVNRYQYSKNVIDVVPVELLNSDWGMDEQGSSGTVTNSMSQEIIPEDGQTVKKIYVKEGQKVKIGDKLLVYDMARKKLELELKGYDVKEVEFAIQRLEKDLANLKKGIVSASVDSDTMAARKDPILASLFLRSEETAGSAEGTNGQQTSERTTAPKTPADETTPQEPEAPTKTEAPENTTQEKPGSTTEKPGNTTEKPSGTTEKPDGEYKATLYSTLTYSSKAYRGKGTSDSPYRYLCSSDCRIKGSFINRIRGYNSDGSKKVGKSRVVILEVRNGNSPSGSLINSLTLYGSQEAKKNPDSSWKLDSYVSGDEEEPTTSTREPGDDDPGSTTRSTASTRNTSSGGDDTKPTYTKQEINDMIAEKEKDLAEKKLDLKEAKLEYDTMKKEVDDGTITAIINGIVKEISDPDDAASDGSAVLTVSSEGNLYVKGAVDEFSYKSLQKDAIITAKSWETGNDFEAKVTEVSPYPVSNGSYYNNGMGNPNVSYYPFTAIIETPSEDINSGDSVTINFNKNQQVKTDGSIYLPLAFVRTENGSSYVYLRGKDKKLKKQYVTTGQTLYNYVIEIKSGLKANDSVAFPYGKNIKEGAKTKVNDDAESLMY